MKQSNVVKSVWILQFLLITLGVAAVHLYGRIFPSLCVIFLIPVMHSIYTVNRKINSSALISNTFVWLTSSVVYRVVVFEFPPTSSGLDPDTHAVLISRLIDSASIAVIDRGFYASAPLFYLFPSQFSIISDLKPLDSLVLYSIVVPVVSVFSTLIISRELKSAVSGSNALPVFAVAMMAVSAISIYKSYVPVPQSLAISSFYTCFVVIVLLISRNESAFLLMSFVAGVSLLFTHKLPLLVVFLSIVFFVILSYLDANIRIRTLTTESSSKEKSLTLVSGIGIFFLLLLSWQWSFMTIFARSVIIRVILLFEPAVNTLPSEEFTSVSPAVTPEIYNIVLNKMYALLSLPVAGLSWLVLYKRASENQIVQLVLAASAVTVFVLSVAIIRPSAAHRPSRYFFFAGMFIWIILAYGLSTVWDTRKGNRLAGSVISILFISLVLTQLFTVVVAPDNPNQYRRYLDESETEAWEFTVSNVREETYTDYFYADYITENEAPDSIAYGGADPEGSRLLLPYNKSILNGKISPEMRHVLHRKGIDIMYTRYGKWRLRWNLDSKLSSTRNKVYTTGDTVLYY